MKNSLKNTAKLFVFFCTIYFFLGLPVGAIENTSGSLTNVNSENKKVIEAAYPSNVTASPTEKTSIGIMETAKKDQSFWDRIVGFFSNVYAGMFANGSKNITTDGSLRKVSADLSSSSSTGQGMNFLGSCGGCSNCASCHLDGNREVCNDCRDNDEPDPTEAPAPTDEPAPTDVPSGGSCSCSCGCDGIGNCNWAACDPEEDGGSGGNGGGGNGGGGEGESSPTSAPASLTYSCNVDGTQATITWATVANADFYSLRVNDNEGDFTCNDASQGPSDVCKKVIGTNSFQMTVQPGRAYSYYVHTEEYWNLTTWGQGQLVCAAPTPTPNPDAPKGFIDWRRDCWFLSGWACDPNNWDASLQIEFYANAPKGSTGSIALSSLTAIANNKSEPGVNLECNNTPNHRFTVLIPDQLKSNNDVKIYAYAKNVGTGNDTLLQGSPYTIRCPLGCDIDITSISCAPNETAGRYDAKVSWRNNTSSLPTGWNPSKYIFRGADSTRLWPQNGVYTALPKTTMSGDQTYAVGPEVGQLDPDTDFYFDLALVETRADGDFEICRSNPLQIARCPANLSTPVPTGPGSVTPTGGAGACRKVDGDANCDGQVNVADFTVWMCEYMKKDSCGGKNAAGVSIQNGSDFDGQNGVTLSDFVIWRKTILE